MMTSQTTPDQIIKQLRNPNCCFWIWNAIHYVLGLAAAVVGTVVIAQPRLLRSMDAAL